MSDTVTIDFEKVDGTEDSLIFHNVEWVDEVEMSEDSIQVIAYKEEEPSITIDHVVDYDISWS